MMKSRVSQEYTENCLALFLYLGDIWAVHIMEQPRVKAEVYVEPLGRVGQLCQPHLRIMLQYGDTALTLPLQTWVINTIVDEKIFTHLTLLPKCGNPQFGTVLTGPFEFERLLIAQPIDFPLNYFKVKELVFYFTTLSLALIVQ